MANLYPYTDFHEMNLDWVIAKVKELTAAWIQVQQDWTDEQAAFNILKNWVENYFANLNVQVEINNKIDDLVTDGTMSELIAPYVASGLPAEVANQISDVVAAQIGAVVAAQIGAVVADQLPAIAASAAATEVGTWLSTHIDPDTGYVIDDTLTTANAAADAKATGDKISEINSALTNITDNKTIKYEDKTDTGTSASFWNTNPGITADDIPNAYVKVVKAVNATNYHGYINISIAYTDNSTATANYVDDVNTWHKITYNAEKTISAVYIQYLRADSTLAEAVASEWEYVIVKNKPITERVTDAQNDADENASDIGSIYSKNYFDAEWVNGAWYDGVYGNPPTNRVCTHYVTKALRDWTIYVKDGFKFYVEYFDNSTFKSETTWITDSCVIRKDSDFALTIAKVTEITEVADIYTFLDAITIVPTQEDLPSYMVTALNTVRDSLVAISKTANVALIGFNTDQHVMARTKQDRAILGLYGLAYLSKLIPLNCIVLGGDAADYNSITVQNVLLDNYAVQTPVQDARCMVIPLVGNHDAKNDETMTNYALYGTNFRNLVSLGSIKYKGDESCNGYYDDASVKIRFIYAQLDACVGYTYNSAEYFEYIGDCIDNAPSGYKVILFSHESFTSEYPSILPQGRALQSVLNPRASKILCVISGHAHRDDSIVNSSGILFIETTCAWNQKSLDPDGVSYTAEDGTTRTNGTVTETAYDVFAINPTTGDVYAVRYGAGNSRTWLIADRIPNTDGLSD